MATTAATALPSLHSIASGASTTLSNVNESSSDAQTEDELEASDDHDSDSEPDLEVDAMADALLQDINSQILAQLDPSVANPQPMPVVANSAHTAPNNAEIDPKSESEDEDENPMIATINVILAHAASNPPVKAALDSTPVPCAGGASLFTVLSQAVVAGGVAPELAEPLSVLIAELARSPQPPSPSTSTSPSKGKRKREASDDGDHLQPSKQPRLMQPLGPFIPNAVGTVTHVMQSGPISTQMVASLQTELHDVFVFAATASGMPTSDTQALQQILNLIHALSLMSGIPIGSYPSPAPTTTTKASSNDVPPPTSNRAAIHPCQFPGCNKTFNRLALLRNHARLHTVHRPYKCSHCPASFLRNHDLVRHVRGHSNTAFRCIGCNKTFTRRDAAKRHKENPKSYPACKNAEIQPVYVEGPASTSRRGDKMWSLSKAARDMEVATSTEEVEDGEINPPDLGHALILVQSLHALLHGHVSHWQTMGGHSMIPPNNPFPPLGTFTYASYVPQRPPPQYDPALFADSPTHSGLDQDQTSMLEQAIAFAAAEAQEEALLEEEDDDEEEDGEEGSDS